MAKVANLDPTTIRADIVARLIGKTAAAGRVFDSREISLDKQDLPAVVVYSDGFDEPNWSASALTQRTERIGIAAMVGAANVTDAEVAAALDTLTRQVICALRCDRDWRSSFQKVELSSLSREIGTATARKVGRAVVVFALQYSVIYTGSEALEPLSALFFASDAPPVSERQAYP